MPVRPSPIQKILQYLERVFKRVNDEVGLCTGCLEKIQSNKLMTTPCDHKYCPHCMRRMATAVLDNPEMFPARCCGEEIPPKAIVSAMNSRNKKRYIVQWEEQKLSPLERLYCPRVTCGRWIPPRSPGSRLGYVVCPHCRTKVCPTCREFFHLGWSCSHDSEMKAVMEMARENNWQRCSNCLHLVEKVDGCNHMVCRCGHQFCYICGQRGRCQCPSRGVADELGPDEDLGVDTVVAAMEEAELGGERCWWTEDED